MIKTSQKLFYILTCRGPYWTACAHSLNNLATNISIWFSFHRSAVWRTTNFLSARDMRVDNTNESAVNIMLHYETSIVFCMTPGPTVVGVDVPFRLKIQQPLQKRRIWHTHLSVPVNRRVTSNTPTLKASQCKWHKPTAATIYSWFIHDCRWFM